VGFVFQNYQLMPELTALENVSLAARIAGVSTAAATEAARALLTQVGLGARLEHLPAKLSGGECQRVAIARAGAEIMDLLLGVVADRGAALILVTHSRQFAERATRRFVLSGGVLTPA
jgi:putative ABC transport system ATP-binding protein